MTWEVDRCPKCRCFGVLDCFCLKGIEVVEVVSASFTDEDVERVAEAEWKHDTRMPWSVATVIVQQDYRERARAALSAYLEFTTKGDT